MKILQSTARGAIVGALVGVVGAFLLAVLFLGLLHNIPDFLWVVFPVVMWEHINKWVLTLAASMVYSVPTCMGLGGLIQFVVTAARG